MRMRFVLGLLATSYVVAAVACGARSELLVPEPPPEEPMNEGGGPPDCVVFNSSTELSPLDVFVMLDRSGSMDAPTGEGITKWFAVRNALEAFFYDPESRGIGVGFSYFPIIDELVPELCNDDDNCGAADACLPLMACPTTFSTCQTNADCDLEGNGDTCEPLGQCSAEISQFCIPGIQPCNPAQGVCQTLGFCENRFTCDSQAYEVPDVDVGILPDHGYNLLTAFGMIGPDGGTPTLPALTGAVDHAVGHAAQNPGNNVIVVLATDGVPTVCDDDIDPLNPTPALDNLRAAAARGAEQGVQTFVIGVFAPEEEADARPSLEAIAQAGGTGQAFIVNTAGSVATEFREALNQVRVTSKACEFDLVQGDEPIDYDDVWVRMTRGGEEVWIKRVSSAAACDDQNGGFYYDQPVPGPVPPTSVRLCPATCELLGSSPDRTVEIFTTCGPGETGE